jgi:hypothetical protein
LEAFQLLRRTDLPGLETLLVAGLTAADLFDIGVGLALLAGEVAGLGLGGDGRGVELPAFSVQALDLGRLRDGTSAMRQLVEARVEFLDVEKPELDERVGVQWKFPSSSRWPAVLTALGTWTVHGSVQVVDTRVSTVVPRCARTRTSLPAASASHGHSLAQCATSTSAGASGCWAASEAGWWRRSAVT